MHPAAAGCMKRLSGIIYDLFQVVFTAKMSPFTLARSDLQELEEIHGCSPDISTGYIRLNYFQIPPKNAIFQTCLGGGNSNMFYVHPENWGFRDPIWLAHIFFRWVETEPATSCILLVGSFGWFPWCWSNELPWLKEGCNMEMKHIWDRSTRSEMIIFDDVSLPYYRDFS